jgi:SHS2 domain-containing protein
MRNFKLLPHDNNIRLCVEADSIGEIFKGALNGMAEIMKKGVWEDKIETVSKMMSIRSIDQEALLIDFLSEILDYSREEKIVYSRMKIVKLEDNHLSAEIFGRGVGSFDHEIKIIAYHKEGIKKNKKGNWETAFNFNV